MGGRLARPHRQEWAALHRDVTALIRAAVPLRWAEFVQGLLLALDKATAEAARRPEPERREAINAALERALQRETLRLNANELRDEGLETLLGPHWAGLKVVERRYLACARRCADLPSTAKFALLELGCAVEWSLLDRVLQPLRAALQEGQHGLPSPRADAKPDKLRAYLAGEAAFLMLGDAVRGYTEATKLLAAPSPRPGAPWPDDARGALAAWLSQCPNPGALHAGTAEQLKARRAALHALSDARNVVAHPKLGMDGALGGAAALAPHWQAIVADPADAFFRYFPAVFIAPEPAA